MPPNHDSSVVVVGNVRLARRFAGEAATWALFLFLSGSMSLVVRCSGTRHLNVVDGMQRDERPARPANGVDLEIHLDEAGGTWEHIRDVQLA